jgi:hypothetical protein
MSVLRSGVVESLSLGQAELGAVAKRPLRRGASTTDRAGKRTPELMAIGRRIER